MTVDASKSESPKSGVEISPQAAEARKAVKKKLVEKRDEMISQITEAFNERVSYGGDQMSEQAKNKILFIRDRQIEEVRDTYDKLLKKFEERIAKDSSVDMEALANELLESANDSTRRRLEKLKVLLSRKVEGTFMTTAEVFEVDKAVQAIEQFEKSHPELHSLFVKIGEGGSLTGEEFSQIINLINPADLSKIQATGNEAFETTSAGLLIGVMTPAQRFELVKNFIKSDKKTNSGDLIDAFLKTGVLTVMQGEDLYKMAVEEGAITREKYDAEYKEKIEGTFYSDQLAQFREVVGSETAKEIGGKFSRNVVDRFVGMPMLHTLLMLWGGTTLLVNILASRTKGDLSQTIKNIAKNEFFWLGAAATGVGVEGASGTMREGRGRGGALEVVGIGEGTISAWMDKILNDEDKKNILKRNGLKVLAENYSGAPADFRTYLEKGGHSTILKLKSQKDASGAPSINLEKMIIAEENAEQKARLEKLKPFNDKPEMKIDKLLIITAISAEVLEIDESKEHLADWLKKIRDTQIST